MADQTKSGVKTIPTLTDVVVPSKGDRQESAQDPGEPDPSDLEEELPLEDFGTEPESESEHAVPEYDAYSGRPEILRVEEMEHDIEPFEVSDEPMHRESEPDTMWAEDDDQRTDEVAALPLQVAAMVDEILERHLALARDEILRRLAELIEEPNDTHRPDRE